MRHLRLLTLLVFAACSSNTQPPVTPAFSAMHFGSPRSINGAIFLSTTSSVAFAAAPYQAWQQTSTPLPSVIAIALTKSGLLFAGEDTNPGAVYSFSSPYTAAGIRRAGLAYVIAMAVDRHDNVWVGADNALYRLKAPSYAGAKVGRSAEITNPQSIAALPDGKIAVTFVKDTSKGFRAGGVAIYTPSGSKVTLSLIKSVPYPQSLIVDRKKNLIVASCSQCFSQGQVANELALIAPPYTKLTHVITKLPNISTSGMGMAPNGDLFVIENNAVILYPEPYKKGHSTAVADATAIDVNNAGDLIYSQAGTVYLLAPPYSGKSQQIYSTFGQVEQIITAQ